jgi:putative transposase
MVLTLQGTQFTADAFTDGLARAGIQISRDGRGRRVPGGANSFIERLWRSVKYEDIYRKELRLCSATGSRIG